MLLSIKLNVLLLQKNRIDQKLSHTHKTQEILGTWMLLKTPASAYLNLLACKYLEVHLMRPIREAHTTQNTAKI